MSNTTEINPRPTADEIADMVDRGEDISGYLTGKGIFLRPGPNDTLKTEIRISHKLVHRLLRYANESNLDVQLAIEQLLHQSLDQHSMALQKRDPVHAPESAQSEAA